MVKHYVKQFYQPTKIQRTPVKMCLLFVFSGRYLTQLFWFTNNEDFN